MKKRDQNTEKKLSLKKTQMISITNLRKITGGLGGNTQAPDGGGDTQTSGGIGIDTSLNGITNTATNNH